MSDARRALVVASDRGRAETWEAWLRSAGYATARCSGPGLAPDCPRLHGARCVLREVVDVAIVDLAGDEDADLCTKVPDDGSTVFVQCALLQSSAETARGTSGRRAIAHRPFVA